jgi:2-oxoglutarate ferredoxin oxidoreductase subunit gamma
MDRTEIRITGFGGQGVVLAGYILGRAAAIHAGHEATMIQSFGPEARGSACTATLVIAGGEVLYPYVRRPDILVAMSADGYEKYRDELVEDGLLLYESDLVRPAARQGPPAFGIPSTRIAESLGRRLIQNIVMVGFFAGVTELVPPEAVREAVEKSVPAGTEKLNLAAFERGLAYAREEYAGRVPRLAAAAVAHAAQAANTAAGPLPHEVTA